MLEDAAGIRRVVLACGTVDLRKGIDGLATIIGDKYGQNPFEKGTLFLFCGKRSDRCKGLLEQDSCFYINALKQDGYPGQETYRKPQILPKSSTNRIRTIHSSAIRQERCNCTLKTLYFQRLTYEF